MTEQPTIPKINYAVVPQFILEQIGKPQTKQQQQMLQQLKELRNWKIRMLASQQRDV